MKGLRGIVSVMLLSVMACGGKLSDEQRKQLREGMKSQEIKVVTEAEITEEALRQGREILLAVEKDSLKSDSAARASGAIVRWLDPEGKNAGLIESQLLEAYIMSAVTGAQENIQKAGADSLIYTKPVVEEMPDGTIYLKGVWSI